MVEFRRGTRTVMLSATIIALGACRPSGSTYEPHTSYQDRGAPRTGAPTVPASSGPLPPTASADLTPSSTNAQNAEVPDAVVRLARLKSYEGVIIEQGVLPKGQKLKTEIRYRWPSMFRTTALAPLAMKGVSVNYLDNTLIYSYPQLHYAIRIRHLKLPDGPATMKLMADRYHRYQKEYSYRFGKAQPVTGLPTLTLFHSANQPTNPHREGWHRIYNEFAFSLAATLRF